MESLKILIHFGADPLQKGVHDMTAADFAVLFGAYNTAYYLNSDGYVPTKSPEEYIEIKSLLRTNYVDYCGFLMSLEKRIPIEIVPFFTLPPIQREPILEDPINDPNETWGSWVNRVLEFEKPRLVERSESLNKVRPAEEEDKFDIILKESGFHADLTFEMSENKKFTDL